MQFGNLGFMEILLILVVVLLLFGAKRIPEIAGSFGKGIREFKRSISDVDRSIRDDVAESRRGPVEGADPRDRLPGGATPPAAERTDEAAREPKRLLS